MNSAPLEVLLIGKTTAKIYNVFATHRSTLEHEKISASFIRAHGSVPAFLGYGGFPNSICSSLNDQVVHGIPSAKTILKEGDVLSVDCGTLLNGFVGDSAYTFPVGEIAPDVRKLLTTTKESLYLGIQQAVENHRLGDVSHAVQSFCESKGFSFVRELVGHGIGKKMNEEPDAPT